MNRSTPAGVAALLATTTISAVFNPTAMAAPPTSVLPSCNIDPIELSAPLRFTANSNATTLDSGVSTGQKNAMVGGKRINTQLGELDGRPYTLTLMVVDQSGVVVTQSSFLDNQPIVMSLPAFVGPNIDRYTVEGEITLAASRTDVGCSSQLFVLHPKTRASSPALANIKVVPLCSASTLRDFNLGGSSVIGQPYTHVFNPSTIAMGPLNVDITHINNVALPAPVQVAVGNSVSYVPQSRYTPVHFRTYEGPTWNERECWRESFTYEEAAAPVAAAQLDVGLAVTAPLTLSPIFPDDERPQRDA
jgi:hypothetical protein